MFSIRRRVRHARNLLRQRDRQCGSKARVGQSQPIEKARKLNREIFEERDLLFGERANLLSRTGNHAKKHTVSAQRYAEQGASAHKIDRALRYRVIGFRQIGNVGDPAALDQWPGCRIVGSRITLPQHIGEGLRQSALCDRAEPVAG